MAANFKPNMPNIVKVALQSSEVNQLISKTADSIAQRAASRMGWKVVNGASEADEGQMRREDDDTPNRARAAVIALHPNATERQRGREALRAAMGGSIL